MIVVIGVTALCLGAVLARRFRVLILVPFVVATMASVGIIASLIGHSPIYVSLASAWAACALQLGYLVGLGMHPTVPMKDEER